MGTPAVGEDIEDTCSRCGDNWHVVMAKLGERVVKVVCKRCGTQHNYRGENNRPEGGSSGGTMGAPRRRTFTRRPSAVPAEPTPPPPFDPNKPPRTYNPKDVYAPGERIDHPAFGVGVVSALPGPGKVEVAFPTGARVLACAKAESTLARPVHATDVPIADRPPDDKS